MKQIANLLLAAFFALSACTTNKNEATIKGKIIGEIPEYLKYSESVNEICLGYFNKQLEMIQQDSLSLNLTFQNLYSLNYFILKKKFG